jgi:hypothetical protein
VAHVLVGKYAEPPAALPAEPDLRQPGVELDRSTLAADWVGRAATELRPCINGYSSI